MKHISIVVAFAALFAVSIAAQETKLQLKDLPKPVQEAAQAEQAKGATLKGFAKEVEEGQTFYEVETAMGGHTRDLLYDAAGKLVEVEEEVANDAVPAAAMKALTARGKPGKVETVTKGGVIVAYESVVKTKAGKNVEVAVDANGKTVKP
jgi:uncharacterized membrane protein YkoI